MTFSFALCFEGRFSEELFSADAPVTFLGECRVRNALSIWRARRRLGNLLKDDGIDIAVVHSAWSQSLFGSAVNESGVPLVLWLHGLIRGKHWLERWASMIPPDFAICNSEFTAAALHKVHPKVKAEVVYN